MCVGNPIMKGRTEGSQNTAAILTLGRYLGYSFEIVFVPALSGRHKWCNAAHKFTVELREYVERHHFIK